MAAQRVLAETSNLCANERRAGELEESSISTFGSGIKRRQRRNSESAADCTTLHVPAKRKNVLGPIGSVPPHNRGPLGYTPSRG